VSTPSTITTGPMIVMGGVELSLASVIMSARSLSACRGMVLGRDKIC
jgi:hypothetical protein